MSNPYVRPDLCATREGIPDPALLAETWLDRLGDLLDGLADRASPWQAYDLLAAWARLRRVRPELIAGLQGEEEVARAAAEVLRRGPALALLALTVPNPGAWLQEAFMLAGSYHEVMDPPDRAFFAEHLLDDLDDANLVWYAAQRCGRADAGLGRELSRCAVWLADHADCFLAAGVHVQAVGMALRADLPAFDPALARTADPLVGVLDALELAEAHSVFAGQPALDPQSAEELFRHFQEEWAPHVTAPPG